MEHAYMAPSVKVEALDKALAPDACIGIILLLVVVVAYVAIV